MQSKFKKWLRLYITLFILIGILASLSLFSSSTCASQSGHIVSDTIWSGLVYIDGDVTVDPGVNLTITPGTEIRFNGSYNLYIEGNLLAVGTSDSNVVFKTNSLGTNPGVTIWLNGTDNNNFGRDSMLKNCTLLGDAKGLSSNSKVVCSNSAPTIENNHIENCSMFFDGAGFGMGGYNFFLEPKIMNNYIISAYLSEAIRCYDMSPQIIGNTILDSDSHGIFLGKCIPGTNVKNNRIGNNGGYGIKVQDCNVTIENNTYLDTNNRPNKLGQILKKNSILIVFKDTQGLSVKMDTVKVKDSNGNVYNDEMSGLNLPMHYYQYILPEYEITNDNLTINYNPYIITANKGKTQITETITTYPQTSLQVDVPATPPNFLLIVISIIFVCIVIGIFLFLRKKKNI